MGFLFYVLLKKQVSIQKPEQPQWYPMLVPDFYIINSQISIFQMLYLLSGFVFSANLKNPLPNAKITRFRVSNGKYCAKLVYKEAFPHAARITVPISQCKMKIGMMQEQFFWFLQQADAFVGSIQAARDPHIFQVFQKINKHIPRNTGAFAELRDIGFKRDGSCNDMQQQPHFLNTGITDIMDCR
jgi:hypothetical protein